MDNRTTLSRIVAALGEYYDKPLSPTQIAMYVEDLTGMEPQALIAAVKAYRSDAKNERFPLPAKLKALANPEMDPEQHGVIVANEIVGAISHCGPYRTPKLSGVAMQVIDMEGGWQTLCELVTNDNLGTFKAQWRNLAKALAGRQNFHSQLATIGGTERVALGFGVQLFHDMPKAEVT